MKDDAIFSMQETIDISAHSVRRNLETVFAHFDRYSCIKGDKWYLELKDRILGRKTVELEFEEAKA